MSLLGLSPPQRLFAEEKSKRLCTHAIVLPAWLDYYVQVDDARGWPCLLPGLATDHNNVLRASRRQIVSKCSTPMNEIPSNSPRPEELPTLPLPSDSTAQVPTPLADSRGEIFGKYEILSELGRGGMGVVFKARQTDLHRTVAIKRILSGVVAGHEDLLRFGTEAKAIACLRHPNIVSIHEVGEIDGSAYFSMDYIEGPNLAQRLAEGPCRGKLAACYVAAIGRAVQHAHDHHILHRDLKPSNILLDAEDQPHVTDFGLAKRLDVETGQTQTGAILGTPSYMAPEQAAGQKQLTAAVDVYGLGAILYELLTGRPPFRAETPLDTLLQVLESNPAPPRLLNPNVDRDVETICLKCLEKDPRRRYATAQALVEDLERYQAGESISARSLNLVSRMVAALEHSHYDVQFRAYSRILFGFALIMFLAETGKFLALTYGVPLLVVLSIEAARFLSIGSVLAWLRPAGLRATSAAERLMWSIWIGYVLTLYAAGIAHWILLGGWSPERDFELYPALAAVTGLAFFALGASYWGWCYAMGLAFHVQAIVMTVTLPWAPLEFGFLWAVALTIIALRLRRFGSAEQECRVSPAAETVPALEPTKALAPVRREIER
jgi:serine/threonine protein kinase